MRSNHQAVEIVDQPRIARLSPRDRQIGRGAPIDAPEFAHFFAVQPPQRHVIDAMQQFFQSLPQSYARAPQGAGVAKILLTASGGPFLTRAVETLEHVTPEQACKHPNWVMGRKISVDSATMMNKGLEVIEAHWLFGVAPEQIEVVVHRESIVHSLVEDTAQTSQADFCSSAISCRISEKIR